MIKKINHFLYNDKFYAIAHWLLGIVIMGLLCILIKITSIISLNNLSLLVNTDLISLSATIAGFELAGVTLLISLNGNKKLNDIKKIGSEKTIYKLFFHSIILLTLSLLLMVCDIYLFKTINQDYSVVKQTVEYLSVLLFVQGQIFFLSSIRMLMLIFK